MSRKVLLETTYQFTPSTKTIVIPRAILRERLILITNVTNNQVIYNFSDPNLRATSYTVSAAVNNPSTTIVLNYNTASMNASDKLQFTYDEYGESFTPSEEYTDPVNKFRVSTPQALIDTDFEYSTQTTKWENLALVNNRPFAFPSPTAIPNISNITMSGRTVTVTTSSAHGLTVGTPISVQDTFLSIANGVFVIETVPTTTTFTYTGKATDTSGLASLFDTNKTLLFTGSFYSNAAIGTGPTYTFSGTAVTVTTSIPHGLAIGNEIAIVGSTATTNPPNGTWPVARIPSNTTFVIYANATPTGTITGGNIYVVPQGQVLHRPFDGGVIFSTNANGNYGQLIRQTRRYFRYQSGKGIQVSSGTILKPALQIDAMTSSGSTVTVLTKEKHNIRPGTEITVSGANETAYNGTFTVTNITGYNSFTYSALSTPSTTIASGNIYASVSSWYGSVNRLGIFDDQNGLFFEFDGQELHAVRRNSTFQLSGKVSVTNGQTTVTQTSSAFPTYFAKQLNIGDFVVIRGQSYRVTDIGSDTSLTITPGYRGATVTNAIMSRTVETTIPQSQWNIDRCDGTGPSGFNLDLSKMQMFYIDYSWYGAGFVRWGFRGPNGNVLYCHKLANNNVNSEAYMRSGNLPARYETQALPPITKINATVGASDTTINVVSTAGFPPTNGTIVLRNATNYEYVNYAAKTATSFTGVTRAQAGGTPTLTTVLNSNVITVSSATGLQVGQRVISTNIPEGTFIAAISGTTVTLTNAATAAGTGTASFIPAMGVAAGTGFSFVDTDPVAVELAYPTFSPTVSHWGTSVIMDGRYDDDKSLIFTFGQTAVTSINSGSAIALFSIRVAPSVDNGQIGAFGARELINRMQLTLDSLGITIRGNNNNLLVTAVLNGTPSTSTAWTNAVANAAGVANSSLAQIASYAGGSTTVSGGEVIAGFYVNSTDRLDLSQLRDLGNCILGGGGANSNQQIYPDGPDTLTFVVRNLSGSGNVEVLGRLSWKEAQA